MGKAANTNRKHANPLMADAVQRHCLAQLGLVAEELKHPDDPQVRAHSDTAATLANYLALQEPGGAIPLLAAQAAGMHELAMLSLSRAAKSWAAYDGHHRNMWDAVRACTVFMRLVDAVARERAAKRAAEKAAEDTPVERAPAVDPGALAEDVLDEIDAREAAIAAEVDADVDGDVTEDEAARRERLARQPAMTPGYANALEEIDAVYNMLAGEGGVQNPRVRDPRPRDGGG